jgi:hypothetical protein
MQPVHISRPIAAVAVIAAVALLAAACGGSSSPSASDPAGGGTGQQAQNGPGDGQGRVPGTFGLIAQISGHTLQVQSSDAQTAVSYTTATKFSQTVGTTKTAVKPGACVVVRSQDATAANQSPTGTPSAPPAQPKAVTAASVEVSAATGGRCSAAAGGFGGGGFGGPGGFRSGTTGGPTGGPTGTPTFGSGAGGQNGQPGSGTRRFVGGAVTFGQVTSVTSSGFVVAAVTFAGRGAGSGSATGSTPTSTPMSTPSATTRSVTVTETGSTTYTTTTAAKASALAVGKCVAARGTTDDTGAVKAATIAISPATNGQCAVRGF